MLRKALSGILKRLPVQTVNAHCDGPCGVYDPASARVAAEAVLSMTKKLLALDLTKIQSSSCRYGKQVLLKYLQLIHINHK